MRLALLYLTLQLDHFCFEGQLQQDLLVLHFGLQKLYHTVASCKSTTDQNDGIDLLTGAECQEPSMGCSDMHVPLITFWSSHYWLQLLLLCHTHPKHNWLIDCSGSPPNEMRGSAHQHLDQPVCTVHLSGACQIYLGCVKSAPLQCATDTNPWKLEGRIYAQRLLVWLHLPQVGHNTL